MTAFLFITLRLEVVSLRFLHVGEQTELDFFEFDFAALLRRNFHQVLH
jgi:hypothetical protein